MGALDAAVLAEVGVVLGTLADAGTTRLAALEDAHRRLVRPAPVATGQDEELRRKVKEQEAILERCKTRLARAAQLLVDGDLDREGYDALRAKVAQERAEADAELARLWPAARTTTVEPAPLPDLLSRAEELATVLRSRRVGAVRAVLAELLERVVPHRLVGRGVYGAWLGWTPLGQALYALSLTMVPAVGERDGMTPTRWAAGSRGALAWRSELYDFSTWQAPDGGQYRDVAISLDRGDVSLDQEALERLARAVLPVLEASAAP
jgi:hypothetical protein